MQSFGIGWQLSSIHGWGVFGANLALQAGLRHRLAPTLFFAPQQLQLHALHRRQLAAGVRGPVDFAKRVKEAGTPGVRYPFPILYALGNQFAGNALLGAFRDGKLSGSRNHGIVFFENTALTPQTLELGRRFDRIVAGSTWNADVLRGLGLEAAAVFQGVDETLFHPAPRTGLFPQRFVIFSGGKLEYRKGQDIVIAAFRAFRERHPEALLLTSWFNPWPDSARSIAASPHVKTAPAADAQGGLKIGAWLAAQGLPEDSFIDIGPVPNPSMPSVLREADAAIFANRCEGGTNLVAMEAMACGIPTILAANTGQRDLIAPGACYVLERQAAVTSMNAAEGVEGWGESSVEEAVEALERVYRDRDAAARIGAAGAARMKNWSWANQVDALLGALGLKT